LVGWLKGVDDGTGGALLADGGGGGGGGDEVGLMVGEVDPIGGRPPTGRRGSAWLLVSSSPSSSVNS